MKQNILRVFLILMIFSAVSLTGCSAARKGTDSTGRGTESSDVSAEEKSFNVRTVSAERADLSERLKLSGDAAAAVSVDVYPETAGKLTRISVQNGSRVNEGQVLAGVDPSRPGMTYAESPVRAPISGTITAVYMDPGSMVSPQVPLVTIGDINRLVIKAGIPERFVYLVNKGQSAWITSTSDPGKKFPAKVTAVSPVVNPSSRTLAIELSFTGSVPIKAGMFVGIELITSAYRDCLVLPEKSVVFRDDQSFVYRLNGDRVERVSVETGITDGGMIEIRSGLSDGDQVVLEGVYLVSDGSRVRVIGDGGNR